MSHGVRKQSEQDRGWRLAKVLWAVTESEKKYPRPGWRKPVLWAAWKEFTTEPLPTHALELAINGRVWEARRIMERLFEAEGWLPDGVPNTESLGGRDPWDPNKFCRRRYVPFSDA